MWTAVVVTCPTTTWTTYLEVEVTNILKMEYGEDIPLVLVVPDPENGVGSGGASLNALLVAVEHLSARSGHTSLVPDLLDQSKLLVIHLGPSILPIPTGLMYISDKEKDIPTTNLARTIKLASRLVSGVTSGGVLVASSDILLSGVSVQIPDSLRGDLVVVTVPGTRGQASRHGVVIASRDRSVKSILYQPDPSELKDQCGDVPVHLLAGLVWFSPQVAVSLLSLHSISPLASVTYMGTDSGEETFQMSLYYDILPAACSGVSQIEFVEGRCGKNLKRGRTVSKLAQSARREVWAELKRYRSWELCLEGAEHIYLPVWDMFSEWRMLTEWKTMTEVKGGDKVLVAKIQGGIMIDSMTKVQERESKGIIMNRGICGEIVVLDSIFTKLVDGSDELVEISYPVVDGGVVMVVLGLKDKLYLHHQEVEATFLGRKWTEALAILGLSVEQVWPTEIPHIRQNLLNAHLFFLNGQMVSLLKILDRLDISTMLDWRRDLQSKILCNKIVTDRGVGKFNSKYLNIFRLAVIEDWAKCRLLPALDQVTQDIASTKSGPARSSKLAQILAVTADLLGSMSKGNGGLRSGPAHNKEFNNIFTLIEAGQVVEGLTELVQIRNNWLNRPDRMVRAARHYEGLVQLCVRQTVLSAKDQIKVDITQLGPKPPFESWVVASCPARLDLSGGWTDTPPICYEMGGKVVDLAIKVDGKKPIGCRVMRHEELTLVLGLSEGQNLIVRMREDMMDFCNPTAPGALVKCCLIASGVVDMNREGDSFLGHVISIAGGGLRLELWSDLPQGSGLGTSSILAGAVLAAIWGAVGATFTRCDIVHAVLVVEQLLTTGGGWQDQVGGLHPGVNVGQSRPDYQVCITTEHLDCSDEFLCQLEDRLLLLYTGKPRLAKNLLQNVIRNWYSQESQIVECFQDNFLLANECWSALTNSDLDKVGSCLSKYWNIKKILAPGSEPQLISNILKALEPHIVGGSLAGAGGGGFLVAILTSPGDREVAIRKIRSLPGTERVTFHTATVDRLGLELDIGGEQTVVP